MFQLYRGGTYFLDLLLIINNIIDSFTLFRHNDFMARTPQAINMYLIYILTESWVTDEFIHVLNKALG